MSNVVTAMAVSCCYLQPLLWVQSLLSLQGCQSHPVGGVTVSNHQLCIIVYQQPSTILLNDLSNYRIESTVRSAENQHALPFYGSQKLFISGHKSDTYRYTWLSRWSCFSHLSWITLNGEGLLNYIPFKSTSDDLPI